MDARHATHTLIVEGGEWDSFCFECAIDVIFHHEYEINRLRSAVLHVTKCLEEITDNLRSIRRDVYSAILEKLLLRMQINGPQVSRNRTGVANGIPNFLFSFCLDIKLLHHLSITEVIKKKNTDKRELHFLPGSLVTLYLHYPCFFLYRWRK